MNIFMQNRSILDKNVYNNNFKKKYRNVRVNIVCVKYQRYRTYKNN